jgi:hypothetical protein
MLAADSGLIGSNPLDGERLIPWAARLPAPSSPANCIDPSKISTHKLTHRKLILATPYSDWQPPLRM